MTEPGPRHKSVRESCILSLMFRGLFAWINRYERHLSAGAMLAGFVFDSLYFGRVDDLWNTHLVFLAYAVVCFATILLLHYIEARGERTGYRPRWRPLLPIATQFALGGFWSGFLVFYGRSAAFGASWPFLLFVIVIFIGAEVFRRYHERLVFTSVLFFFALYSYAIFAVPVATKSVGTGTFLLSGAIAIAVFALFIFCLRLAGRERYRADIWRIRAGALGVLLAVNLFYFANILPPLPLAAEAGGIYHNVARVPGAYMGMAEVGQETFLTKYLGYQPTLHVIEEDSLYAYSSVFAPTALAATVVHRWQWYNPVARAWETRAAISYPIQGGRDGGYRGYSAAIMREEGKWRVSVETADGRVIARLPFRVVFVLEEPALEKITLP